MSEKNSSSTNRVCLACGQIHDGKICPLIEKKLNKYTNYPKKNHLIGNILLKCIEKGVDFLQILLEIAEQNEERYDTTQRFNTILPIENSIEYFAVSLGCSSWEFLKNPKRTVEEYSELISPTSLEWPFLNFNDNGEVDSIEIPVEIPTYTNIEATTIHTIRNWNTYSYFLSKEKDGKDGWIYSLYLEFPVSILQQYKEGYQKEKYPNGRIYCFSDMTSASSTKFLLASDRNGVFKRIFENELNESWKDEALIQEIHLDDERYKIWTNKLITATRQGLLQWKRGNNEHSIEYHTFYDLTEISLYIRKNLKDTSESYIRDEIWVSGKPEKYSGTSLYVRNREGGLGVCFRNSFDDESKIQYDERALALADIIDSSIVNKRNGKTLSNLKKKTIEYSDVIITAHSIICNNHYIKPLRGILQLLTGDNKQIEYEIYVGYCSECNKYYCFDDDYREMLKYGTPLCAIYDKNTTDNKKVVKAFYYKSQSVLNAMGYSVRRRLNLSANERQKILETALQNKLVEVHDLISFLNWLIQTRKTQSKYDIAISKWQEDLLFAKNFEREAREKVNVKGMIVKR